MIKPRLHYHFHFLETIPTLSSNVTIIFLHGWMGSSEDWKPFFSELAQYHIIAFDLPGHGKTKVVPRRKRDITMYFPQNIAQGLIYWIESHDLKNIILVGYSMGGRIASLLAPLLRNRLKGVILESSGFGITNKKLRKKRLAKDKGTVTFLLTHPYRDFLSKWYQNPLFGNIQKHPEYDKFIDKKIRLIKKHSDLNKIGNSLIFTGNGYMPSALKKLPSVPVLYLTGEKDKKYSAIGKSLRRQPNIIHMEISGCGHNIHFEKPVDFLNQIKDFTQSLNKN